MLSKAAASSRLAISSSKAPTVDLSGLCFFLVKCLVLPNAPPSGNQTRKNSHTTSGDDDTTASLVSGLLAGEEEVGREPVTHTANAISNGNECSSFGPRPRDDGCLPRNLDVETNKRSGAEKDQGKVSGAGVESRDHDDRAYKTDCNTADDVPTVLQMTTTGPRNSKSDKVGDNVGWCLNEIRYYLGESKSSHDLSVKSESTSKESTGPREDLQMGRSP